MTKSLEQRLHEGSRAREVLENEAFIAAFEAIETTLVEEWKNSPARDAAGREKAWTYLHLLTQLKACLTKTLETGKLAELEVHHRSLGSRIRDGLTSWAA